MLIYKYDNFTDIPGSKIYSDNIPVFATQSYADYLKEIKGHDTVWFACLVRNTMYYLLPFAVFTKLIFRKGYFVTGVISLNPDNTLETEKDFLENVVTYIKKNKLCDWIQQGPNWALFNTFPSGSKEVKFGTYRINLKNKNEAELFKAIKKIDRQDINKAIKSEVIIKKGADFLENSLTLINDTAKKGDLQSLTYDDIKKLLFYFKDNLRIYVSYKDDVPQSSTIFLSNKYCVYALYSGSKIKPFRGSNSYLFWEVIKDAKNNNFRFFDFVGARINPAPGSKLEGIQRFKEHFGGDFIQGYLWKMNFSIVKHHVYQILIHLMYLTKMKKYKPDIIDEELKRIKALNN